MASSPQRKSTKNEHSALVWIRQVVPIAAWLPRYRRADARGDLTAGLTVGVMSVPQGMAYAVLAGMPPIYGLYAALVPLLVYTLLGTSRQLAVSPIAVDMMVVAAGLGALAAPGSLQYVALGILLTMMVGAIQLAMGAARLGFLVNLLSRPVIAGFTSAAALIIAFSQLGNLLGLSLPQTQHIYTLAWTAFGQIGQVSVPSATLGLGSIALLAGLVWWKPLFPAPLLVVVLTTFLSWKLGLGQRGVETVGAIPSGLPRPAFPSVDLASLGALWPTALAIALLQFMGVMSLSRTFAARHNYSVDANRELWAVGAANFLGSFFRSLPVSGSFSRSAVNDQVGARTPASNLVAATVIALTLLFLTPLFAFLPLPALAAIIIVAAFGLFDWRELRALMRIKSIDGALALLTFLATLLIGIQAGLLIGIGASVVAVMYRISRPNVAELGHLPGTRSFRDVSENERATSLDEVLLLRVDASFSFANAEFLKDLILEKSLPGDHAIEAVVIDASSVNDLDTTAVDVLHSIAETLEERGVAFYFGGVKTPVREVMQRAGLVDQIGDEHFFLSPHRAVKHVLADDETDMELDEYTETVPGEQGDVS